MQVTLVVVGGKADKRQLTITLPTILGRSRQADLTIAHSLISRTHCELAERDGVVVLRDRDSLNGTFCRQRRIEEVQLYPNDEFSIGPLTFRIQYQLSSDASVPASGAPAEVVDLPAPSARIATKTERNRRTFLQSEPPTAFPPKQSSAAVDPAAHESAVIDPQEDSDQPPVELEEPIAPADRKSEGGC